MKESVASEMQQRLDELVVRMTSDKEVSPNEVKSIQKQFAGIVKLASDNRWQSMAELAISFQSTLKNTRASQLLPCLRGAVAQMRESMGTTTAQTQQLSTPVPEDECISDPGLIADFVVESKEHLASAEEQALALEKEPGNAEAVNSLFRAFHSIKGLAAFLQFDRVYRFAHEVETLLDHARNHELTVTPAVIDIILASADFLTRCMDSIQAGTLEALSATEGAIVERIRSVLEQCAKPVPSSLDSSPNPAVPMEVPVQIPVQLHAALPEIERLIVTKADESHEQAATSQGAEVTAPPAAGKNNAERYSIRVDTTKLDYLMDMVGELVIAQSLIRTEILDNSSPNSKLVRSVAQLTQITNDVQRTTLRMRMIPIGQLLMRSSRIVRDLARKCGKQVEVELEGEDTEVDKTIAEELADPLMHIVRNAIDHGIETPEERALAGKSAAAKVRLTASHEGSQIVVQVSDDGRGLDRAKILRKAREKNLVSEANLDDADIIELIFSPGFSTAEKITTVSGRGVGMDVVRRHVEKLRGHVDVESEPGRGTRFIIRLPLTRAIIDGLVVRVGDSRYVIPLNSVREIFRPSESAVSTIQASGEVVLIHNRLLPIVRLHRQLLVEPSVRDPWDAVLIVAEAEGRQFCIMVDELLGKQEVVVKSLGQYLSTTPGVSGGTILGDGRVGLILDVQQIEVRT